MRISHDGSSASYLVRMHLHPLPSKRIESFIKPSTHLVCHLADSVSAHHNEAVDHFWVSLVPGLLKLLPGALTEDISPREL